MAQNREGEQEKEDMWSAHKHFHASTSFFFSFNLWTQYASAVEYWCCTMLHFLQSVNLLGFSSIRAFGSPMALRVYQSKISGCGFVLDHGTLMHGCVLLLLLLLHWNNMQLITRESDENSRKLIWLFGEKKMQQPSTYRTRHDQCNVGLVLVITMAMCTLQVMQN